ncbi:MAG: ATP-binding protein, partial [Pseudomonadota bacterium]
AALAQGVVDELSNEEVSPGMESAEAVSVKGYPALLRRALRNLVSNGLRYGGAVTVRAEQTSEHVLLIVDDEGPGVSDANLERLKEPFIRGEMSRSRETGGAGLGLAIADGAARAHQGALELSNRPEGGFRAILKLPRN